MADLPAVFQRCNAIAEQRDMLVSYMAGKAQIPGQVGNTFTSVVFCYWQDC